MQLKVARKGEQTRVVGLSATHKYGHAALHSPISTPSCHRTSESSCSEGSHLPSTSRHQAPTPWERPACTAVSVAGLPAASVPHRAVLGTHGGGPAAGPPATPEALEHLVVTVPAPAQPGHPSGWAVSLKELGRWAGWEPQARAPPPLHHWGRGCVCCRRRCTASRRASSSRSRLLQTL